MNLLKTIHHKLCEDEWINESYQGLLSEGMLNILNSMLKVIDYSVTTKKPLQHKDSIADILASLRCYKFIYNDPDHDGVQGIESFVGSTVSGTDAVIKLQSFMTSCKPQYNAELRLVKSVIEYDKDQNYADTKDIINQLYRWLLLHSKAQK